MIYYIDYSLIVLKFTMISKNGLISKIETKELVEN